MAKWIQRVLSLVLFVGFIGWCASKDTLPTLYIWPLAVFGFLTIWLGEWAVDRYRPTTTLGMQEYGCLVYVLGWMCFLLPLLAWLIIRASANSG